MAIRKITRAKETKFDALSSFLSAIETGQVEVKYDLVVSNDVSVRELYIGYTKILLKKDQDPEDMNHFSSGLNSYICSWRAEGLKVIVIADGMTGGFWRLRVSVKSGGSETFKELSDNPIQKNTDNMGHLDHNQFHN